MTLIAYLRLYDDVILFTETFDRVPDVQCSFEDYHYIVDEDRTHYVFFWWCSGCDLDELGDALAADPTVRDSRVVTDLADGFLVRIETVSFSPEQPLVFPLFREYDVTMLEAKRDANGLHLQARFPSRDALLGFLDAASDIAENVGVIRLFTDEEAGAAETTLTEKQRAALTLAFERGYFESPSRVTLDELAAEVDISPQALSGHIRAAVRKLVEHVVETGDVEPRTPPPS